MDTDKVDRARRAKELTSIFESVMNDGHTLVGAERATLFMVDEASQELWSQVATGTDGIIKVPLGHGCVGHSATTGTVLNVPNAYRSSLFDSSFDEKTGYKTVSVLVVPIRSKSETNTGAIIGAIEMINKRTKKHGDAASESGSDDIVPFTEDDEAIATVLASHVATFIRVVEGS
jgi:GAF domain-containing protein